jgi:hypothetical protein
MQLQTRDEELDAVVQLLRSQNLGRAPATRGALMAWRSAVNIALVDWALGALLLAAVAHTRQPSRGRFWPSISDLVGARAAEAEAQARSAWAQVFNLLTRRADVREIRAALTPLAYRALLSVGGPITVNQRGATEAMFQRFLAAWEGLLKVDAPPPRPLLMDGDRPALADQVWPEDVDADPLDRHDRWAAEAAAADAAGARAPLRSPTWSRRAGGSASPRSSPSRASPLRRPSGAQGQGRSVEAPLVDLRRGRAVDHLDPLRAARLKAARELAAKVEGGDR